MTELMRQALRHHYAKAKDAKDAHPGLLIQRGLSQHDEQNKELKTQHIQDICKIQASEFYQQAYNRWLTQAADCQRFATVVLTLETRLFIGLTGGGMLETGCAISHSYGMPYIPGSSVKGVVNAQVRRSAFGQHYPDHCDELFGAAPSKDDPDGLAGLISFHDAWWVPQSTNSNKPFVEEVVTTHHLDYYGKEGAVPASDLDSPIPNAQIAVQGSFLFVLEGPADWLPLAKQMLVAALTIDGIGAKTRAGYGLFHKDETQQQALAKQLAELRAQQQRQAELKHQQAEEARKQALLATLSPLGRQRVQLEEAFTRYQQQDEMAQKNKRSEFIGKINGLLEQAQQAGADSAERLAVADLLTRIYDAIGWGDPGQKKDKREKQEQKRRQQVERLRSMP